MSPLFGWLRSVRHRREQAAAHAAAWAQDAGSDGLKPFQGVARDRLDNQLAAFSTSVQWSVEPASKDAGPSLVGRATSVPLTVWLHDDTFSFALGEKGDYFEWWDYDTPEAMIEQLVSRVKAELRRYGIS